MSSFGGIARYPLSTKSRSLVYALRAGAGKEFEASDRGAGPHTGEAVEVVRRRAAFSREINHDVAVD